MGTNPQKDRLFACLAHHHRRILIDVLRTANSPKSTIELTHDLAGKIHEATHRDVLSADSLRVSLHHSHLPKLSEAGLITYDKEKQLVEPIEYPSELGTLLEIAETIAGDSRQTDGETRDQDDERIAG